MAHGLGLHTAQGGGDSARGLCLAVGRRKLAVATFFEFANLRFGQVAQARHTAVVKLAQIPQMKEGLGRGVVSVHVMAPMTPKLLSR